MNPIGTAAVHRTSPRLPPRHCADDDRASYQFVRHPRVQPVDPRRLMTDRLASRPGAELLPPHPAAVIVASPGHSARRGQQSLLAVLASASPRYITKATSIPHDVFAETVIRD